MHDGFTVSYGSMTSASQRFATAASDLRGVAVDAPMRSAAEALPSSRLAEQAEEAGSRLAKAVRACAGDVDELAALTDATVSAYQESDGRAADALGAMCTPGDPAGAGLSGPEPLVLPPADAASDGSGGDGDE